MIITAMIVVFGQLTGCSQTPAPQPEPIHALEPPFNAPRELYTGTLHVLYDTGRLASAEGDTLMMPHHPLFTPYEDSTMFAVSRTEYITLSSAGRSQEILECGVSMGVVVLFDGASSSKVTDFIKRHPDERFVLVVANGVLMEVKAGSELTAHSLPVPTRTEHQSEVVRQAFVRNTGQ